MTRVTADEVLKTQFKDCLEPLEIVDESGQILGFFQPIPSPIQDRELYDWAKADINEEELERARQSTEWYTTEEVLKHLRSL